MKYKTYFEDYKSTILVYIKYYLTFLRDRPIYLNSNKDLKFWKSNEMIFDGLYLCIERSSYTMEIKYESESEGE